MQISSRFTIAVHIFACIDTFKDDYKITSDFLAASVNVNPVIIRKILSQLKNAGLVEVKRGSGGATIAKELEQINFYDIYSAVECIENGELFHFHENPNSQCPVGRNIPVSYTHLSHFKSPFTKGIAHFTTRMISNISNWI